MTWFTRRAYEPVVFQFSRIRHWKRMSSLIKPRSLVLDVGCGQGSLQNFLCNSNGCECIGVDLDLQVFRGTRQLFVVADDERLPFRDAVFDVVMPSQYLEHVSDLWGSIKEQIRVLRADGKFILDQANLVCPLTIFNFVFLF